MNVKQGDYVTLDCFFGIVSCIYVQPAGVFASVRTKGCMLKNVPVGDLKVMTEEEYLRRRALLAVKREEFV